METLIASLAFISLLMTASGWLTAAYQRFSTFPLDKRKCARPQCCPAKGPPLHLHHATAHCVLMGLEDASWRADAASRRSAIAAAAVPATVLVPLTALLPASADESEAREDAPASPDAVFLNETTPKITARCWLEIAEAPKTADGAPLLLGRLNISVYGEIVPKTADNFIQLCSSGSYQNSTIYRIVKDYALQMGDIGAAGTGKSGRSAQPDGSPLPKENTRIRHSVPGHGVVSMVRDLKTKKVDSRFFITLVDDAGWADSRFVAFGRVQGGEGLMEQLGKEKVEPVTNRPVRKLIIADSGVYGPDEPLPVSPPPSAQSIVSAKPRPLLPTVTSPAEPRKGLFDGLLPSLGGGEGGGEIQSTDSADREADRVRRAREAQEEIRLRKKRQTERESGE
ncbi:unnamed protein product [Vitrella brassicaformis CCMP3155]|uniref:peptidylprolyl isomerase n=3 Tax=Vitrella brassicaformis TaxID=1169539 RepID=A0A0G4FBM6_VITBC|nr:unnamed protein product [Vitrella brassicaformis CCMP3155]|mmetsp:Transcript_29267/g.84653  ORF Transcript_29267/g.84653 Transcript_29267/m.84653 type:complete len:396 (+) Transcript_29267:75-1262(+)|eukprot:CEM10275.1 unnamed protein product [Vitrella brassicaformis CCMP3155]